MYDACYIHPLIPFLTLILLHYLPVTLPSHTLPPPSLYPYTLIGAGGFDVCFIHPKSAVGVLVELVQAPPSVIKALE